ncbi:protein cornichon homolog 4 [Zootermopsis nevadensis]|uniref:Cornichon-like protein 4 n=1 Tax=Zootermopsis nevadensis TaxID=136037 RepID=A0A067RTP7_ZOONE|nr:protein cornichon homolog 4 [Zootermopsis nevadensis]XP_021916287.1 protein cornichon homolog 4 [Zootermopsis nevadensis]XP_021916297.1 protein cornichon homolog 4 [Zootermopsis nevadensis]KDR24185.1 Cornichon-like protein 4 [Zootermopsis nevadensis]
MVLDSLLFPFSMIITGAIIFLLVYFVICLSDLECDYLNAQQCCSKLNAWVLPKLIAQDFLTLLFLLLGHWILAFANLPLAIWLAYEYYTVPTGNTGMFDPTEIHNRGKLKKHMRDCMIYLGYYFLFFFVYLYW